MRITHVAKVWRRRICNDSRTRNDNSPTCSCRPNKRVLQSLQQEKSMASTATELRISDLPKRHASALKRKAQRLGISTGDYVKQLIEDDLVLDQKAQSTSLEELAAPFRKALKGASEAEIANIVSKLRSRRRR